MDQVWNKIRKIGYNEQMFQTTLVNRRLDISHAS